MKQPSVAATIHTHTQCSAHVLVFYTYPHPIARAQRPVLVRSRAPASCTPPPMRGCGALFCCTSALSQRSQRRRLIRPPLLSQLAWRRSGRREGNRRGTTPRCSFTPPTQRLASTPIAKQTDVLEAFEYT